MIAIDFVDDRARNRLGQAPLTGGRDERVAGRDEYRGGYVHRADPLTRVEGPQRPTGLREQSRITLAQLIRHPARHCAGLRTPIEELAEQTVA